MINIVEMMKMDIFLKDFIIPNALNKRSELLGVCRHMGKWTFEPEPDHETSLD